MDRDSGAVGDRQGTTPFRKAEKATEACLSQERRRYLSLRAR